MYLSCITVIYNTLYIIKTLDQVEKARYDLHMAINTVGCSWLNLLFLSLWSIEYLRFFRPYS